MCVKEKEREKETEREREIETEREKETQRERENRERGKRKNDKESEKEGEEKERNRTCLSYSFINPIIVSPFSIFLSPRGQPLSGILRICADERPTLSPPSSSFCLATQIKKN